MDQRWRRQNERPHNGGETWYRSVPGALRPDNHAWSGWGVARKRSPTTVSVKLPDLADTYEIEEGEVSDAKDTKTVPAGARPADS